MLTRTATFLGDITVAGWRKGVAVGHHDRTVRGRPLSLPNL
jgi:hypothetical protein